MPEIIRGGGSGGGGTVNTDGVTITGTGSSASKIAAVGNNYFVFGSSTDNTSNPANKVRLTGFGFPSAFALNNISMNFSQADASGLYDFGIYSAAGVLLAHSGPVHVPNATWQVNPVIGGPIYLPQGMYLYGFTGNGNSAIFNVGNSIVGWGFDNTTNNSTGGTLPGTVTPPAFAPVTIVNLVIFT